VLSIFCFQGYTEPDWVEAFERDHACRVRVTYTSTIEEMFEETAAAPEAFHLISVDSGRVRLYEQSGLIQPIPVERIPHYRDLDPYFRSHPFGLSEDGESVLHVPFVWGTQTLVINCEQVTADILDSYLAEDGFSISMDLLLDPAVRGRTALFDEAANVFAVAAMHCGVPDPHHLSEAEWPMVENRIRELAAAAATFTTGIDSEFSALSGGEVWVLLGGNDALLARQLDRAGIADSFLQLPLTEGTHCWIDGWSVTCSTRGETLDLALAWIDRMISEEGQKQLVRATGFGPASSRLIGGAVAGSGLPWYQRPLADFPGRLVLMSTEEDAVRRVNAWKRIKAGVLSSREN